MTATRHPEKVENFGGRPLAVVFDLFITLTDFDAERRRPSFTAELAAALGVEPTAFASLMRSTFTERATGALGDGRATLGALARRLGASPSRERLDHAVALRLQHEKVVLTPRSGVLDVLGDLRTRGYLIGVLTDCTPELPPLWPSLPYAAVSDAVTFSCAIGARKPDPALYRDIASKLGVDARDCVYVGDGSSGELTGAAGVGMEAVLLVTPFGDDFRYDPEPDWAGDSLTSLEDLPTFLDTMA